MTSDPVVAAVATGHMGGNFAAEAKYAGWDSIIVQGKASGPCYIAIRDDKVDDRRLLRSFGATACTASPTEITEAMGTTCQVAAIGLAGQNLVAQSVIMCNSSHSAGAGMGAVLGSKNCVGIGVVGTGSVKIAADKRAWRTLVDNAMGLIGSCYDTVLPNSPQPWAEYTATGMRWYAKKGAYWGAANPPVETGLCDPHDRQSVGMRCFKSDPGKIGEMYTVRMEGCAACPVRCHQLINVPSAAKWDMENTYAQNTCIGWWGNGVMDTTKYTAAMATRNDTAMTKLESYVVGKCMSDDMGITNNYGPVTGIYSFLCGTDQGATRIKPVVTGNMINVYGTKVDEWTYLNNASANADSGRPGLLYLRSIGDLRSITEWGRLVANRIGILGKALGDPSRADAADRGRSAGSPSARTYLDGSESQDYWGFGRRVAPRGCAHRHARPDLQRQHPRPEPHVGPDRHRQRHTPSRSPCAMRSWKSSSSRAVTVLA